MKKKILIIAVLVALLSAPVFSIGIGAAFSAGFVSLPSQAMLSLKLDEYPAVFGVGASLGADSFQIGVTADWWLYRTNLVSIFDLYIGPGLYAQIGSNFGLGIRIPVGLQAFVLDPLELFLEIAPALGISFGDTVSFPNFGVQGGLGFRFWF
ncbi:MAG: hypothetical protein HN368_11575 [Spirochaetales bacterium]|jgi:hypothetical protein|nr:hypothetical protein [Spirochaetales bacterium]